jgi:hypothetical protein
MKIILRTKDLVVFVVFMVFQANTNVAQTNLEQNAAENHSLPSLSQRMDFVRSHPWPDVSQKQETLRHCAEVLSKAFDKGRMNAIATTLTDQSDAAINLERFSKEVAATLTKLAELLANTNLVAYTNGASYQATISNPDNQEETFGYYFAGKKGPIQQIEQRTVQGRKALLHLHFYENGKLKSFDVPRSEQSAREVLACKEDGGLDFYSLDTKNSELAIESVQSGHFRVTNRAVKN